MFLLPHHRAFFSSHGSNQELTPPWIIVSTKTEQQSSSQASFFMATTRSTHVNHHQDQQLPLLFFLGREQATTVGTPSSSVSGEEKPPINELKVTTPPPHHSLELPQPPRTKQSKKNVKTEEYDAADVVNFDLRFQCPRASDHSEVSTVGTFAMSTTKPMFRIVVSSPSTAAAAAFGSFFRSTPVTNGKTECTATILAARRVNP
ncbi:uncharacterized protein LOC130731091 [Lotus japonicus]|uniref:uncharacterized protein LOC130731091 n=1 Tax=Lotus japonicus TaxID=34305 RepID=UPI0025903909|nr:uncharacterized protein LOC130731091 [Lotus japonicus]